VKHFKQVAVAGLVSTCCLLLLGCTKLQRTTGIAARKGFANPFFVMDNGVQDANHRTAAYTGLRRSKPLLLF
jgi:hypothetical protein